MIVAISEPLNPATLALSSIDLPEYSMFSGNKKSINPKADSLVLRYGLPSGSNGKSFRCLAVNCFTELFGVWILIVSLSTPTNSASLIAVLLISVLPTDKENDETLKGDLLLFVTSAKTSKAGSGIVADAKAFTSNEKTCVSFCSSNNRFIDLSTNILMKSAAPNIMAPSIMKESVMQNSNKTE